MGREGSHAPTVHAVCVRVHVCVRVCMCVYEQDGCENGQRGYQHTELEAETTRVSNDGRSGVSSSL